MRPIRARSVRVPPLRSLFERAISALQETARLRNQTLQRHRQTAAILRTVGISNTQRSPLDRAKGTEPPDSESD